MAMVLTAFITKFMTVLSSYAEEESVMLLGVPEEIDKLRRRLARLQNALSDAETREIAERAVKYWLKELRDFMYDAEDIIEEYGLRINGRYNSSSSSSSSWCWSPLSCIRSPLFRHEIGLRIKNLNLRLNEISKDKDNFTFSTIVTSDHNVSRGMISRSTSPLVEHGLVGTKIEDDTRSLVELLIKDESEVNVRVFAITGMPGIGKTTLAQKIFNNENLVAYFYSMPTVWVSVCQDFFEIDVLRAAVRGFGGDPGELTTSKQHLEINLHKIVANKRFFLVLDDVWDARVWMELLKKPLESCAKGSRVLVTTRRDAVAMEMQAVHRHQVEKLSDEDGWALLSKKFISADDKHDLQRLRDIGMEIVKKCDGLPLAIKAIAGVLMTKERNWLAWNQVLQDSAWKSTEFLPDGVMGSLYLSYKALAGDLKQCFLYFSLFPKSNLYQGVFVRLWIAEGFIVKNENESSSVYELAIKYWKELIERNILQPNPACYNGDGCKLHDLFQSLAQHLAKDECFYGNVQSFGKTISSSLSPMKPRRLYIVDRDAKAIPESMRELTSLRSLLVQMPSIESLPADVFKKLKSLRIIDFSGSSIEKLPESIGNLILLRYLELSQSHIREIPENIGNLINLHALILLKCKNLKRLPKGITSLQSLQNLNLDGTPIDAMPRGIERLHKLRVLTGCVLSKNSSNGDQHCTLEDMKALSKLRHLCLHNLETVTSRNEAISASMKSKKKLCNLELYCTVHQDYQEEDIRRTQEVFEELCPSESLEGLIIDGYFGREYPNWMTNPSPSLPNLTRLELINCKLCKKLPPLGSLYYLDYLDITSAPLVTKIGPEFFGIEDNTTCCFPKLKHLYFCDMPNWEEWSWLSEDEERTLPFPPPLKQLQKLVLQGCPKLRSLPEVLLRHCTALTDLALTGANCVEEVKNLHSLKHILLIDCLNLSQVSNMPRLERLMITRCRKLVVVERLDALQHLVLHDQEMESLPEWLITAEGEGKFMKIQKMDIESNAQLLSRCLMDGPEWMKMSYIPLVKGYTPGITDFILYFRDPLIFHSELPNADAGNGGGGGGSGDVAAGCSGGANVSI